MNTSSLSREKTINSFFAAGIAVIMIAAMLTSCKNDVQTVLSLDVVDTLPQLNAREIEILYSEKGQVKMKLVSPYLVNKTEEEDLLLFPEGFMIYFYDTAMNLQSTIRADYGISYEKKKIMEARHNVVVYNLEKDETLNTEELFWDRGKQLIFSNKFVKITSGGQVVTGDGLTSAEPFDVLEIKNPKGLIEIKEESQK